MTYTLIKVKSLGNNHYYVKKSISRIVVKFDPENGEHDIVSVGIRSNVKHMKTCANYVNNNCETENKKNKEEKPKK